MTGIEIMEVCKEQTTCEKCPEKVKKACKRWKEELVHNVSEPWELRRLVDEKEY